MTGNDSFKQFLLRKVASVGGLVESFTKFTLTGVAGLIGLFISNISNVREIISASGLRIGLILFTTSLLLGLISKAIGMAVSTMLDILVKMEEHFQSAKGQEMFRGMTLTIDQLGTYISEAFPWPISSFMAWNFQKGAVDLFATEKRCIRMFLAQVLTNFLHWAFGIAGIVALVANMEQ